MPTFTVIAVKDAERSAMSDVLAEYAEYLNNLDVGEAGRLSPSADESVKMVRMRLSAAARYLNKKVIIRYAGDDVLFWVEAA